MIEVLNIGAWSHEEVGEGGIKSKYRHWNTFPPIHLMPITVSQLLAHVHSHESTEASRKL